MPVGGIAKEYKSALLLGGDLHDEKKQNEIQVYLQAKITTTNLTAQASCGGLSNDRHRFDDYRHLAAKEIGIALVVMTEHSQIVANRQAGSAILFRFIEIE